MHDINHEHNYHNRTRHLARQFNEVEKDCSCKGVAVEASYECPPGIEAPAALGAAAQLIDKSAVRALREKRYSVETFVPADAYECPCNK